MAESTLKLLISADVQPSIERLTKDIQEINDKLATQKNTQIKVNVSVGKFDYLDAVKNLKSAIETELSNLSVKITNITANDSNGGVVGRAQNEDGRAHEGRELFDIGMLEARGRLYVRKTGDILETAKEQVKAATGAMATSANALSAFDNAGKYIRHFTISAKDADGTLQNYNYTLLQVKNEAGQLEDMYVNMSIGMNDVNSAAIKAAQSQDTFSKSISGTLDVLQAQEKAVKQNGSVTQESANAMATAYNKVVRALDEYNKLPTDSISSSHFLKEQEAEVKKLVSEYENLIKANGRLGENTALADAAKRKQDLMQMQQIMDEFGGSTENARFAINNLNQAFTALSQASTVKDMEAAQREFNEQISNTEKVLRLTPQMNKFTSGANGVRDALKSTFDSLNIDSEQVNKSFDKLQDSINSVYSAISSGDATAIKSSLNQYNAQLKETSGLIKAISSAQNTLVTASNQLRGLGIDASALPEYKQLDALLKSDAASTEELTEAMKRLQNISSAIFKESVGESYFAQFQKRIDDTRRSLEKFAEQNPRYKYDPAIMQEYNDLLDALSQPDISEAKLTDIQNRISGLKDAAKEAGIAGETMGQKFKKAVEKFGGWLMVTRAIMATISLLKQMVKYVSDLDKAMTELKKVTDETTATYNSFLKTAAENAQMLGSSLTDVVTATADYARLGYSLADANTLAKASILYKNVGDGIESISDASASIISTMKAFRIETANATEIVDKFNEVGNRFPITSRGIGDALLRSAASLAAAGNTLDESIGLIVAMNEVVQDPDVVGTALKTLSMRIRNTAGELEELGEDAEGAAESVTKLQTQILNLTSGRVNIMKTNDEFKSTYEIVSDLAKVWNTLSDIQKASITRLIAGVRQGNAFTAMVENFAQAVNATNTALNSTGSALQENEKYLDSIAGVQAQFTAKFQGLAADTISSETVKNVVKLGSALIDLLQTLGGFPQVLITIASLIGIIKAAAIQKNLGIIGEALSVTLDNAKAGFTGVETAASEAAVSMSMFQVSAAAIVLVLSAVIAAVKAYNRAKEESRARTIASASEYNDYLSSLDEYKDKLLSLKETLASNTLSHEESYNARKEVLSIQNELIDKYGKEAESVDTLSMSVRDLGDAFDTMSRQASQKWITWNYGDIQDAITYMNSERTTRTALSFTRGFIADESIQRKLRDIFSRNNSIYWYDGYSNSIDTRGTVEENLESLTRISEELQALKTGISDEEISSEIDAWISAIGKKLSELQDTTYEQNKQIYEQYIDYLVRYQNDSYSLIYRQSISAIEAYSDALAQGADADTLNNLAQALVNAQSNALKVAADDPAVIKYFNDIFSRWQTIIDNHQLVVRLKADDAYLEKTLKDALQKSSDLIAENSPETVYQNLFDPISIREFIEAPVKELHGIDPQLITYRNRVVHIIQDVAQTAGISTEEAIQVLEQLGIIGVDSANSIASAFGVSAGAIEEIQKSAKVLSDAYKEMSDSGELSIDTIMSIIALGEDYFASLDVQNGKVVLNATTFSNAAKLKINSLIAEQQEILNASDAQSEQYKTAERAIAVYNAAKDAIDDAISARKEETKSVTDLTSEIADLAEIQKSIAEQRSLSTSAVIDLITKYPELATAIHAVKDGYILEAQALETLIKLKTQDLKLTAQQNYNTAISNAASALLQSPFATEATAANFRTRVERGEITSAEEFSTANGYISGVGEYVSALLEAKQVYDAINQISDDIASSEYKFGSTGGGSKEPSWLTSFKNSIAEKKHLLEMDRLTTEEYTNWLEAEYKRAFAKDTSNEYITERWAYEEEVYNNRIALLKESYNKEKSLLEYQREDGIVTAEEYYSKLNAINEKYYKNSSALIEEYNSNNREALNVWRENVMNIVGGLDDEYAMKRDSGAIVARLQEILSRYGDTLTADQRLEIKVKINTYLGNEFDDQLDKIDHELSLLSHINDSDEQRIPLLQKQKEIVQQMIAFYRSQGYSEDSDKIQDLRLKYEDLTDAINDAADAVYEMKLRNIDFEVSELERVQGTENQRISLMRRAQEIITQQMKYYLDQQYAYTSETLQRLRSQYNSYASAISSLFNSSLNTVLDTAVSYLKRQKQAEIDALQDRISAENDAYNAQRQAIEDSYSSSSKAASDSYSAQRKAMDDYYSALINSIQEAADAQKDALQGELDAYRKRIDAQKEALDLAKEERNYNQEVSDRNKTIAELQRQITALSLDDSLSARAKRLELESKLSEEKRNLQNYQSDYATDKAKDALEKEYERFAEIQQDKIKAIEDETEARVKAYEQQREAYMDMLERQNSAYSESVQSQKEQALKALEEQHNAKVKELDTQIEAISEYLKKEGTLRRDANKMLLEGGEELWQKMMEYEYEYNAGFDDIVDAWKVSQLAMGEYNNGQLDVLRTLQQLIDAQQTYTQLVQSLGGGGIAMVGRVTSGKVSTNTIVDTGLSSPVTQSLLSNLASLTNAYQTAKTDERRGQIMGQGNSLAAQVAAMLRKTVSFDAASGKWLFDGVPVYHSGGIIGEGNISPKETLAILNKGEGVLTQDMLTNVGKCITVLRKIGSEVSSVIRVNNPIAKIIASTGVNHGIASNEGSVVVQKLFDVNIATVDESNKLEVENIMKRAADYTIGLLEDRLVRKGKSPSVRTASI